MAAELRTTGDRPAMSTVELVQFVKQELKQDDERQARVTASSAEALPPESQTGATLDLSHKNISTLPIEIIALMKDKVERLALSHNPQITLPTQIVQCDRLRYLNLRWNQLKLFPEAVLQLSALEILDISKNRITSIPEDIKNMTSLKFLAVARNRITRLPLALGEMNSLHKLQYDENPIEFPPPEALKISADRMGVTADSEKEKDACQQVKRFLKAAALRQRLHPTSSDTLSESNVETPRPPKRSVTGGRFPVRPSVSNIDNIDDLQSRSSSVGPPPIPLKSHARNASGTMPGSLHLITNPVVIGGGDVSRNRSDTASTSASLRSRRQGFVQRKQPDLNALTELSTSVGSRSSQTTIKASIHSRASSSVSTTSGFLSASSGGETSSGAVSPVDGLGGRQASFRRLSSLPESRHSRLHAGEVVRAARRLVYVLSQLHRPVEDFVRVLGDGTPRRSVPGRLLSSANNSVLQLDSLLSRLDNSIAYGTADVDNDLKYIVMTSVASLQAYGAVARELKQHIQKAAASADGAYVRCLMHQIHYTLIEARNICTTLGFKIRSIPRDTARVSHVNGNRTTTPTPGKLVNNKRLRGATILRHIQSGTLQNEAKVRTMAPSVPLSSSSSRTNTMTSLSAATPRSIESFSRAPSMTRSSTIRSVTDESDNDEQFDRIFLKLQSASDLAHQSLPRCRAEFIVRKDNTATTGQHRVEHHWSLVIQKCDALIHANSFLLNRLGMVRLKDPTVRYQRDFWQLCDTFVRSWTDLATELKELGQQRVDIATLKSLLRPVQKAVKEVSKTISESPLYHQAVRPTGITAPFSAGLQNSFPPPLPTAHGGYAMPLPATPLSAALGPAVQATVASTPTANEYFTAVRSVHEQGYPRK
nr:leucine-rich repeat-containing protein sog2 [Quercus suber]